MTISDELLMAYVDGELDAQQRAEVERAVAADSELAQRVARQEALRSKLRAAFDGVLSEPIPDRLLAAARNTPVGTAAEGERRPEIVDLAQIRAERTPQSSRRWSWPHWGAMAASVILGVIVSYLWQRSPELAPIASRGGRLVARAQLADALTSQLASTQSADAAIRIGVTFRSKSGELCRTFVTRDGGGLAGFACRHGDDWALQVLARSEPPSGTTDYRPAGSDLPTAVLQAVDDEMAGAPLSAAAESAAQKGGWR